MVQCLREEAATVGSGAKVTGPRDSPHKGGIAKAFNKGEGKEVSLSVSLSLHNVL